MNIKKRNNDSSRKKLIAFIDWGPPGIAKATNLPPFDREFLGLKASKISSLLLSWLMSFLLLLSRLMSFLLLSVKINAKDNTFNSIEYLYFKCNLMKGLGHARFCTSRNIMYKHNVNFLAPDCHL